MGQHVCRKIQYYSYFFVVPHKLRSNFKSVMLRIGYDKKFSTQLQLVHGQFLKNKSNLWDKILIPLLIGT